MKADRGKGDHFLPLAVSAAVIIGLIFRLFLIWKAVINSDEAIVGLIGMEILKGHHFAFYWGQSYMGSLEAYGAAVLFYFLGVSATVLKMVPFFFFLAAAALHFLFVDKLLGRRIAMITLGLFFFASPVFTVWATAARGGYMESLAFGGAALLLGAAIGTGRRSWGWYFLLGIVLGIGFWTHFYFVYYILPLSLLVLLPDLLKSGLIKKFLAISAGLLSGASPAILYNLQHSFASLKMTKLATAVDPVKNIYNLAILQMPTLLGGNKLSLARPIWQPLSLFFLGIYAFSTIYYPLAAWRRRRGAGKSPLSLLLLPFSVIITVFLFFLATGFGRFNTQRYLLPAYPMFIIFLAVFLHDLAGSWKKTAVVTAVLVLAVHTYGNYLYLNKYYLSKKAGFMDHMYEILNYSRENNIRTAYAGHWECYTLTFLSRQELVVADFERDRYQPFQRLVSESSHPSIIVGGYSREIGSTLRAIGYRFKRKRIGHYTVFDKPALPSEIGIASERQEVWIQEADGGCFSHLSGGGLVTQTPQEKGMSLTFSLGEDRLVNGLLISPGKFIHSYPRNFLVETSTDGLSWEAVKAAEPYIGGIYHLDNLKYKRNGWVSVYFPPRQASLIRLTITKGFQRNKWAVVKAWAALPGNFLSSETAR